MPAMPQAWLLHFHLIIIGNKIRPWALVQIYSRDVGVVAKAEAAKAEALQQTPTARLLGACNLLRIKSELFWAINTSSGIQGGEPKKKDFWTLCS